MRLARTSMLAAVLLTLMLVVDTLPGTTISATEPAPTRSLALNEDPDPNFLRADQLRWFQPPTEVDILIHLGLLDYPTDPPSYFDVAQIVSFYGHPGVCMMGELGCHATEDAVERIRAIAADLDRVNGSRSALAALHLIVDVAQPTPQDDGSYLDRMSMANIAEWVEVARHEGMLLFLDLQIGWSDPLLDVQRLAPFLDEPFVHVALDPEFATGRLEAAPGRYIGSLTATQVNEVQDYLGALVRAHDLPRKILVLHQFESYMLLSPDTYDDVREVEITIDMDGWGSNGAKLSAYELFALAPYAERAAFKLFYHWDIPEALTPEQLVALTSPPDYVIYQ